MGQIRRGALSGILSVFICAMAPAAVATPSAPDFSGQIVSGHARFTVVTPTLIRIEYDPNDKFIDAPSLFAVNRGQRDEEAKVYRVGNDLQIETGRISLNYIDDGHPLGSGNLSAVIHSNGGDIHWTPGMKNAQNLGGTLNSLDHVSGPVTVQDGLIARDGWHVIDDSNRFILVNGWVAQRPAGSGTDWYLFGYGRDYGQALKDLSLIGGKVPLPRKYVLGSWFSRWWPYTSDDYRAIVQQFHDHDFPLDVVVMDMDWHKTNSWTGYSWNTKLFPDAPEYLQWLHSQHLFATLNDHPQGGVGPYENNYADFMRAMGADPSKGQTLPYNTGDEKYITTLFKFMHDPLENMGVDFWWVDWMGDSNFVFNKMDWVNELYFRHSMERGLRGEIFDRWGDWGDHRHPILFSGDTHIAWSTLQFEIPFTAMSSNAGAFYWSHDMGGFEGSRNGELLARWVQFGALSAALRLHSTNKFLLDKRPWTYGETIEDSMRMSYHVRSEIFPYIYSSAWEATDRMAPLVRPLYYDYAGNEEAYHNPQEYLFGDAFLVAPIVVPGTGRFDVASQTVWFPPGDAWYDWFDGERFDGGSTKTVSRDIFHFPLFVKGGVPLPLQPYSERMTTAPLNTLVVRAYPGRDGAENSYDLYEDDGLTKAYENGAHALTRLKYLKRGNVVTVTIDPTQGTFDGQIPARSYEIQLPDTARAGWLTVDGKPVSVNYDASTYTNKAIVPPTDIHEKTVVQFWFSK